MQRILAGLIGAYALASTSPAAAHAVDVRISGKMTSGQDGSGIWGPHNGDLTGRPVTIQFSYDPGADFSQPCLWWFFCHRTVTPGVSDRIEPVLQTAIIINGRPFSPPPDVLYGILFNSDVQASVGALAYDFYGLTGGYEQVSYGVHLGVTAPTIAPSLEVPLSTTFGVSGGGTFQWVHYTQEGAQVLSRSIGAFTLDQVRLEVPEPTTWTLMILGFGLAGGQIRRRRHARTS